MQKKAKKKYLSLHCTIIFFIKKHKKDLGSNKIKHFLFLLRNNLKEKHLFNEFVEKVLDKNGGDIQPSRK